MPEEPAQPSVWCVVANVSRLPHPEGPGGEPALGTKAFSPGTKLYLFRHLWGDGFERTRVLGRHRGGSRLVEIVVATKYLVNYRAREVFHPHVVQALGAAWTEEEARAFAASRAGREEPIDD